MAKKPPKSEYPFKDARPDDFLERQKKHLMIMATVAGRDVHGEDEYIFSYQPVEKGKGITEQGWIEFFRGGRQVAYIDIEIDNGDTLVTLETVGKLFWYVDDDRRKIEALQTKEDRTRLYGDLRYSADGVSWEDLKNYRGDPESCRLVRFAAKYNKNPRQYWDDRHKFSYNVLVGNSAGRLEYEEIDPDIKNPSS